MKKIISAMIVAGAALVMASCNNQPKQNDTKANEPETGKTESAGQIAYVDVDTIMSQYNYWKDVKKLMDAKQANIEKTLRGKQQTLQSAAANFQQNLQQNKYTQQQAQQIQAGLQKQAQDADALQQRLGGEYQNEAAKYNAALADSIHHYLAIYNKDKKFKMILAKSGDNILLADKSCDVTDEVVAGLNKAYKGMKK